MAPRLENRAALEAARETYRKSVSREKRRILVCAGTGCKASGSEEIYEKILALLDARGLPTQVELREEPEAAGPYTGVKQVGCRGFCEKGPLVLIEPEGWLYTRVTVADCAEIVETTAAAGAVVERLLYAGADGVPVAKKDDIPFYRKQTRIMMEHIGEIDATSIKEYLAVGGYRAFEKALFDMDADAVIEEIAASNLRGRGGGGFPTGRKWRQVKANAADRKYVVCNGDEGDPGAFMDRSVMEGAPHQMIEGMLIAAVACGAAEGYVYVRAEYPIAVLRLAGAIADCERFGLLGDNILGTAFCFRLHINKGAGAFVCGEGSALTASIEGKRGMPRPKLFRTVEKGLFEKPTVLNNVETFANVPLIINRGAAWYRSIGPEHSPGTKTFALTGNIENTGLVEVPMGTTLREIIFDIGGGVRGGAAFKAVQIGGPSGGCLTTEHLDLPLDFDALKKAGAIIGSGGLVVMDSHACMVEIARFFMAFTQKESCGKCIPCREGTRRMLEILERVTAGDGRDGDIELLEELAETVMETSLCGLGKTAPGPVLSTLKYFRGEYEAHIRDKRCPAGQCKRLKRIVIDGALCKGCSKCAKVCPVGAISGVVKTPFTIDDKACVKCGACLAACPFKAVKEEQ